MSAYRINFVTKTFSVLSLLMHSTVKWMTPLVNYSNFVTKTLCVLTLLMHSTVKWMTLLVNYSFHS